MGTLDKALDHLKLSVSRLEASVASNLSRQGESGLRQAQILELQAECNRLKAVTQQVDKGLEKTIDRLKFVLED
jgi:dihydropteroate synthase